MNTQKTELLQPIPALFDTAWELYKQTFIKLLRINWLPIMIGTFVAAVFTYISKVFAAREILDPVNVLSMFGVLFGMAIVSLVASSVAYIAQVKAFEEQYKLNDPETHPGVEERTVIAIYKESAPLLVPYLWVTLITTVIIFAGLILLFVPGVVFAIWLSFAPFIFVVEGERGTSALGKSKDYIRGIWAPVLYRYLALIAFMVLIGIAGGVLKTFLRNVLSLDLAGDTLLNFAYQMIVAPYFLVYVYELYKDVVSVNKETQAAPSDDEGLQEVAN